MRIALSLFALSPLVVSLVLAGCGSSGDDAAAPAAPAPTDTGAGGAEGGEDELRNVEKSGGKSQKWIYRGQLPALEKPSINVSLKSHTARVSGLLPAGFSGPLPFYAAKDAEGDRVRVSVVYPVATGKVDPSTGTAPAAPGKYSTLYAVPFVPTNDKAPWGGFPFMTYQPTRGLAFHGPITSVYDVELGDYEWHLLRGPVSHGCQRMAGEHVVELAHLLGIDMSKPHSSSDRYTLKVAVTVSTSFDTYNGMNVDVDYPAEKGVSRPTSNVKMFKTWLSDDFPRWVCAYQADRPLDAAHCDYAGDNLRDAATGALLSPPEALIEPWVGTPCQGDGDCAFSAGGKAAFCYAKSPSSPGVCSVPCEGYCPDKSGEAPTFCATMPEGGRCLAKAATQNASCTDNDATTPQLIDRYIGTSTAKAAKATVCTLR